LTESGCVPLKRNLVYGKGVNDADYPVYRTGYVYLDGQRQRKVLWKCPYYTKWSKMLERCFSVKRKERYPNSSPTVCDEWLRFTKFKSWMEPQNWENNHLDKDLLVRGNKHYSPETCCFVSPEINSFITDNLAKRGEYPLGVSWSKRERRFISQCQDGANGIVYLGVYKCPNDAHRAWLKFKSERAKKLATTIKEERVAQALSFRYDVDFWVWS